MYSLLIASSAETSFQIKTAYLFYCFFTKCSYDFLVFVFHLVQDLTLLGLGLIKINDVSANFNNPRPSLILNN